MRPLVYADLRCLQDPAYQFRGIGHHVAALLKTRSNSAFSDWKTIGLVDSRLPALPAEFSLLVDETSLSLNPCINGIPAVFIDGSPMTHATDFSFRFHNPGILNAAVLYDFIPLDWPGYLMTVTSRIEYFSKLARIKHFDLYFPISEYTAWRLSELTGAPSDRIVVTGASVRTSFYDLQRRLTDAPRRSDYFLTVGGSDKRKNTEVAVKAVQHLNRLYAQNISLKVVGHYDDTYKRDLLQLAGHQEGRGFVEFHAGVSDDELVSLFAGAVAAIAPSHIEGFSLPIAEASVCGCPVVASTCAAQMELVDQPEALFQSDDTAALSNKLEALLNNPPLRVALSKAQAHLGPRFHEEAVGKRFWKTLETAIENRRAVAFRGKATKPRLAFLSPYPPDESGVARYTAMTIQAGEQLFHSDLYTDAPRPLTFAGNYRDAGRVSIAPILDGRYNGIISVLGNSRYHTPIFGFFERYGGPCILHDSRLTQIYFHRLGQEEFLRFSAKLLGRSVSMEEVTLWLQDHNPPSLFLEAIIERASPLIVHTVTQQALLKRRYGADAQVISCCPTVFFEDDELTRAAKEAARQRRSIDAATFLVSSFGYVARAKGMEACILAIDLLRSWNIPAELYFIGNAGPLEAEVQRIANLYGIAEHVHCTTTFVDDQMYRDFLLASDAAVQLRSYAFGQLSAALTDCISVAIPTVANRDLAESCDAPEYVARVPDHFSPLQVAEQLAILWESKTGRGAHTEARAYYLQTHNFEFYGKRLLEILGIG